MSQELTDAEWLRLLAGPRSDLHPNDKARLRSIAARLERPAVEGVPLQAWITQHGANKFTLNTGVFDMATAERIAGDSPFSSVTVTINPAGPGGRE
jgi:hypothetical protein